MQNLQIAVVIFRLRCIAGWPQARVGVFTYAEVCRVRCDLHEVGARFAAPRGRRLVERTVARVFAKNSKEVDGGERRLAGQVGLLCLQKL